MYGRSAAFSLLIGYLLFGSTSAWADTERFKPLPQDANLQYQLRTSMVRGRLCVKVRLRNKGAEKKKLIVCVMGESDKEYPKEFPETHRRLTYNMADQEFRCPEEPQEPPPSTREINGHMGCRITNVDGGGPQAPGATELAFYSSNKKGTPQNGSVPAQGRNHGDVVHQIDTFYVDFVLLHKLDITLADECQKCFGMDVFLKPPAEDVEDKFDFEWVVPEPLPAREGSGFREYAINLFNGQTMGGVFPDPVPAYLTVSLINVPKDWKWSTDPAVGVEFLLPPGVSERGTLGITFPPIIAPDVWAEFIVTVKHRETDEILVEHWFTFTSETLGCCWTCTADEGYQCNGVVLEDDCPSGWNWDVAEVCGTSECGFSCPEVSGGQCVLGDGSVRTDLTEDECLELGGEFENTPVILFSDPPDGAIDARQPASLSDGCATPAGWDAIDINFDIDAGGVVIGDFTITVDPADVTPPSIISISTKGNTVSLMLDGIIPTGHWTMLTHDPSNTNTRLGYLPADVNGDGTSSPVDILDLIDFLNDVGDPLPEWGTDVDRSGETNPADILTVIDLLNGADCFDPWNGESLP